MNSSNTFILKGKVINKKLKNDGEILTLSVIKNNKLDICKLHSSEVTNVKPGQFIEATGRIVAYRKSKNNKVIKNVQYFETESIKLQEGYGKIDNEHFYDNQFKGFLSGHIVNIVRKNGYQNLLIKILNEKPATIVKVSIKDEYLKEEFSIQDQISLIYNFTKTTDKTKNKATKQEDLFVKQIVKVG